MIHRLSRRQFLSADIVANIDNEADLAATRDAQPLLLTQYSRRAMATEFTVSLNLGQHRDGALAACQALEEVSRLEARLSVFVRESDVSRVNHGAATGDVEVDPTLFELLSRCQRLHEWTEGAFDITSAPLWRLWGFARRSGRVPTDAEIAITMPPVGMRHLRLNPDLQAVRFLHPRTEINLGAIGKGFACDVVGEALATKGVQNFMVAAGGSSVVARGETPSGGNCGWGVTIPHPWHPKRRVVRIELRDQALGTSGSAEQSFFARGRRYSHIIDPRTGYPAEGCISVTVVCRHGTDADALATALFVRGADGIRDFCRHAPEVSAFVLVPGLATGNVDILVFNQAGVTWEDLCQDPGDVRIIRD